jgi:putative endonuclease
MKTSYVYLLSNKNNTFIYTGVTSNLLKRIYQHKNGLHRGFAKKYNCNKLVYFEEFTEIKQAIAREKQIKSGNRSKKVILIERNNPEWKDLSEEWLLS